jgi:glutathione S-transferase
MGFLLPVRSAAYTLDMAAVMEKHKLLDNLPRLRGFMERMYERPKAPPRIAEAFASLRR